MNVPCQLVEDLLPLYYDEICSEDSRTLVDGHLPACPRCRRALEAIRAQVEHPQEEWSLLLEAQRQWKKVSKRRFWLGVLLAFVITSPLWLTLTKSQPVPAEDIQISQVCQLENGGILFHIYIDDGKVLEEYKWEETEDGAAYLIPCHSILEAKRNTEKGLFNIYTTIYLLSQQTKISSFGWSDEVQALYVGAPGDAVLVWEEGMILPKASPAMEQINKEVAGLAIHTPSSMIDWDRYYEKLDRIFGDDKGDAS